MQILYEQNLEPNTEQSPIENIQLPRYVSAAVFALCMTACLFYLMKTLITTDQIAIEESPTVVLNIPAVRKMEPIVEPSQTINPPPEVQPAPKAPAIDLGGGTISVPTFEIAAPDVGLTNQQPTLADGSHLPLIRVQPNYPRRAAARGMEGYTIVEFDITELGLVRNPRIIEAYPSTIFNSSSLKAIQKFRYKPKVHNGQPQPVFGARNKFTFELSK